MAIDGQQCVRQKRKKQTEHWWINPLGYIEGRVTTETSTRRILQHRWLMEQRIGRLLTANEEVHHRDGNRANNAADNLELLTVHEHRVLTACDLYPLRPNEQRIGAARFLKCVCKHCGGDFLRQARCLRRSKGRGGFCGATCRNRATIIKRYGFLKNGS